MKHKLLLAGALAAASAALLYLYYLPPVPERKRKTSFGLVLGCPAHNDGTLCRSQIQRCKTAARGYEDGLYDVILISGGAVKNQYREAEVMKDYLETLSNAPIITETEARNTFENFRNSFDITGDVPITLITSDLHRDRAAACGRQFYSQIEALTYPDHKPDHILRELGSRLVYIKYELQKAFTRSH